MKKGIFFFAICFCALALYVARVELTQKIMPLVASGYGVHIDALEIKQLDTDKIAIETISFKYQSEHSEILFDISDAAAEFVASFDMQQKVSNVFVGYMTIDIRVSDMEQSESEEDKPVETLKSYIKQLPLYGVDVEHLEVEYFENDILLAKYSGQLTYKSDFHLKGNFSYTGFVSSIDLLVSDTELSLVLSDNDGEIIKLQGDYNIDDDWLLFDAHSHYNLNDVQNIFSDEENAWLIQALDGRFDFTLEVDLLQTLNNAIETSAMNADLESSVYFSSKVNNIEQGSADIRMQCVFESMALKNCVINQPQKLMLELSETPKHVADYIGAEIKAYTFEINPNNHLQFSYQMAEHHRLTVNGDAKVLLHPNSSAFNLNVDLSNVDFKVDRKRWQFMSDYALGFDAHDLRHLLQIKNLSLDARGVLKADTDKITMNTRKGASLALLGVEYQDAAIGVLRAQQMNDAEISYSLKEDIFQASSHKFAIVTRGIQYDEVTLNANSIVLDIHNSQLSQHQQSLDAALLIDELEVKKRNFKIQSSDWNAKIEMNANTLIVNGDFLLGVKDTPLEFIISDDVAVGSGYMQFASSSIPLSNNEVVAQIIGMTGYPLQLKDGSVALSGALNWNDAYQDTRIIVNLSANAVGGDYAQNLFSNLNVDMTLEENNGWVLLAPAELTIGEVNVGVPLRDVKMRIEDYEYGIQAQPAFKVVDFFASALEGSIYSNAIDIDLNKTANEFSIYLSKLSLEKLIELNQTQDLFATGIVNGELPMNLNSGFLEIDNGWMRADEQGGVIKYERVKEVLSGNEDLRLVAQLLEDFRYDEMSAVVNLAPDGGLTLNTKLYGQSPDAEFNAPVNLNFNIDLNLWKLLESARLLTRIGQDITEQVSKPGKEPDK